MDYQFLTAKQRLGKLKAWLTQKENQHYEATSNMLNAQVAGMDTEEIKTQIEGIEKVYRRMASEYEIVKEQVEREEADAEAEAEREADAAVEVEA